MDSQGAGTGAHQSEDAPDDIVLPFQIERAGANGRVVRLGPAIDMILTQHSYPESVSKLLGEAVALTALLGASLKFEGKLILQTQSDGLVDMLVVQFETPGRMRGYARFDTDQLAKLSDGSDFDPSDLLGHGHLVMTIDQGADMESYQGIVPLEGGTLTHAAHTYFHQSEQLPTFIKLSVARHYVVDGHNNENHWHWRAGGLMIQDLTHEGGYHVDPSLEQDKNAAFQSQSSSIDGDGWNRSRHLAATVEDHELLDPLLTPERMIYRLFHEDGVRVFDPKFITAQCRCSQDYIKTVLEQFSHDDIQQMIKDESGEISVTCEFCSKQYCFNQSELLAI